MRRLARVKIESAIDLQSEIMKLCLKYCESPNEIVLTKIGSYLGDFTNNLRSALNYTMRNFAENKLYPAIKLDILSNDYKRVTRNSDFPYADNINDFDSKPIVKYTKNYFQNIYMFLEQTQPYHQGNEWLKNLMRISNIDKHIEINTIQSQNANFVYGRYGDGTPIPRPAFTNDHLMVSVDRKIHVYSLPCYYFPFSGFALKGGTWLFFEIPLDENQLGLTRFIEYMPNNVKKLVHDFFTLFNS